MSYIVPTQCECIDCNGLGWVSIYDLMICGGTGYVLSYELCEKCKGTGIKEHCKGKVQKRPHKVYLTVM